MGYYTRYNGEFTIEPALTRQEYMRLAQVVNFWNSKTILERAKADVFEPTVPALSETDRELAKDDVDFSFTLESDTTITANEDSVKGYTDREALSVVAVWLATNGHTLTGDVEWAGEENSDSGTVYAEPDQYGRNRVQWVADVIDNPGPTWGIK